MIASEREHRITEYLRERRVATTAELAALTGASVATVRRDINVLERRGAVLKIHGGAQAAPVAAAGESGEDPWLEEKTRIARAAGGLVEQGDTIFLGAGHTCTLVARYLAQKEGIRVVTTNVNAVLELAGAPQVSMLLLGGDIHVGSNFIETLDEYTLQSLQKYYFDQAFITVDGIDPEYGYSINNRMQTPLYQYLLKSSRRFHVLADSGKFGRRAFTGLTEIGGIPEVIAGGEIDDLILQRYRETGVRLTVV